MSGGMLFYDTKFRFTRDQLEVMFRLQAGANDVMSDAWRTSCNCTIQYYRASFMEGAEAMDHLGWKWWKKFNPNVPQAVIELIDILHFTLSHLVRESYVAFSEDGIEVDDESVFEHAAEMASDIDRTIAILPVGRNFSEDAYEKIQVDENGLVDISKYDFNDLMELFMHICLAEGRPDLNTLYALFDLTEQDVNQIYEGYVAKNLLNLFRTSNGQRENTYCKIWDGREDNEWLYQFINDLKATGEALDVDALQDMLDSTYKHLSSQNKVEKA